MSKNLIIDLDPNHVEDMGDKMQQAYAVFKVLSDIVDENITDDENRHKEMDFVIGLIINMMVNRPYCLNCFMTRFMEVINRMEDNDVLFTHASEEKKQEMH